MNLCERTAVAACKERSTHSECVTSSYTSDEIKPLERHIAIFHFLVLNNDEMKERE